MSRVEPEKIQNLYREFKANQQIFRVLEASKALTEGIFDELPVSLVMVDQRWRILKMSGAAESIFDIKESSVLGHKLCDYWKDDSFDEVKEYFTEFAKDSSHRRGIEQILQSDSGDRYIYWQICPVYSEGPNHSVHALIGNDITDARTALELSKDLEVASAVQNTLLPEKTHFKSSYCEVNGYYEPAAQVSGDLWWYKEFDDAMMAVLIDVMGHGAGSAMVTAVISGALEANTQRIDPTKEESVEELFHCLHEVVKKSCRGLFMACASCVVVPKDEEKAYVYNMGLPNGMLHPKGNEFSSVSARGTPLGLGEVTFRVGKTNIPFVAGDRFVVFTDGCYEFLQANGRQLGRFRLLRKISEFREANGTDLCIRVPEYLKQVRTTALAEDDLTMLVFDRK